MFCLWFRSKCLIKVAFTATTNYYYWINPYNCIINGFSANFFLGIENIFKWKILVLQNSIWYLHVEINFDDLALLCVLFLDTIFISFLVPIHKYKSNEVTSPIEMNFHAKFNFFLNSDCSNSFNLLEGSFSKTISMWIPLSGDAKYLLSKYALHLSRWERRRAYRIIQHNFTI